MKMLIGLAVAFLGVRAHGQSMVACDSIGKEKVQVLEYLVKQTPSRRLGSGIVYLNGGEVVQFDQSNVAQYKNVKNELFLIVDNLNENVLIKMKAVRRGNKYLGEVRELDPQTQNVIRKVRVSCTNT